MSGFFMVRRKSIFPIIQKLQPDGFKILADIIACNRGKWVIKEIGYTFRKREAGNSKMNFSVLLELIALIVSHLSFRYLSMRFVMFGMVGTSGIIVQVLSTFILITFLDYNFAPPCLRRDIGLLGFVHKRVLGQCHPAIKYFLPWSGLGAY